MGKRFEKILHQKRYKNGQNACEKAVILISHKKMLMKTTTR